MAPGWRNIHFAVPMSIVDSVNIAVLCVCVCGCKPEREGEELLVRNVTVEHLFCLDIQMKR